MDSGIIWAARFFLVTICFFPIAALSVVVASRWGRSLARPRWLLELQAARRHKRARLGFEQSARALALATAHPSRTATLAKGLLGARSASIDCSEAPGGTEHLRIEIALPGSASSPRGGAIRVALEHAAVFCGDEERARGCLESRLHDLARPGDTVTLENGLLTYDRFGPSEPEGTIALARRLSELAEELPRTQEEPIEATLARTAEHDTRPEIRLRALRILLRDHARTPQAQTALEAALDSPDPAVRLAGAEHAGPRAEETLRALLAGAFDSEVATQALHQWMCQPRAQSEQLTLLTALLSEPRSPPLRIAAMAWLTRCAPEQAEALLLPMLGAALERSVRMAAVQALARVGSESAVAALFALTSGSDGKLARVARRSITEICGRRAGVSAGGLALCQPRAAQDDGSLSLARGAGDLSLRS